MNNQNWIPLTVGLKGKRDYLQSANVWDAIAEYLRSENQNYSDIFKEDGTTLDVIFKSMMRTNVEMLISPERFAAQSDTVAQVIVTAPNKEKLFGILRERNDAELHRFEDIENSFKPDVAITKTDATLSLAIPISLSQMYVALIKFWHLKNVDDKCKWLATRLQLPLAVLNAKPDKIRIVPGTILKDGLGSISNVEAEGTPSCSGRIYFYKS